MSLTAYEGKEPYIFVSYAHKDSSLVLPLIEALQHEGFRVWFDQGIEAGTEWPEYIEDRLCDCNSMIVFMSNNAVDSLNCRNEINLALSIHKELLVIYLEQTELRHGMRLQLSSVQSMFAYRSTDHTSFVSEICRSKLIASCKASSGVAQAKASVPRLPITLLPSSDGSGYCVFGLKSQVTELNIPSTYNGKPVTSIADYAFMDSQLISVTLPDSITTIGEGAFSGCKSLKSIVLPKKLSEIPSLAFNKCSALSEITLPSSVTVLGAHAFANCSALQRINLNNVFFVYEYAFFRCTSLTSVTLYEKLCNIGEMAFGSCSMLTSINYQSSSYMWQTVQLADGWASGSGLTGIRCTNGNIRI